MRNYQRSTGGFDMGEILIILGLVAFFAYLDYSEKRRQALMDAIRYYQDYER